MTNETITVETAAGETPGDEANVEDAHAAPFIQPVAMEDDPDELFPGDRGVLDARVRRVLVHLLQRRVLLRERSRDDWTVLLDHQQTIESRLGDLFVRLVIDHDRGIAYKQQVRSDELDVPVLLRESAYSRAETLVLVHLRTVYQRESSAGEPAARIDVEEVEQTVLSYFADADGDTARRQKAIRKALERLVTEGVVEEESAGRYRISPLVEIVLSAEKLRELRDWLRAQAERADAGEAVADGAEPLDDDADADGRAEPVDPADDSNDQALADDQEELAP